ncbi:MAG: hypothetical protein ACQGVK_04125 [Myxococcota bacterium]
MNTLGLAIFGISAVISAVVGIRLLWVASRSRELPELTIGLVMLLELVSAALWAAASSSATGQLVSTVAAAGSASSMAVFVRYTFAPDSWSGRIGLAALLLTSAACVLLPTRAGAWGSADFYLQFGWLASLARAAAYAWASLAAGRSRATLRRRARLGLSHPLSASRVGFWCIASGMACASFSIPLIEILTQTVRPLGISPISMVLAIAAAGSTWLAFYPPRVYVTWALSRAEQA